jgi:hypothetical protein
VFYEIPRHEQPQVNQRTAALAQAVVTIRIDHVVERFAQLDEPVHQAFDNPQVRVVLAGAVNDQQVALQALGKIDGRRATVAFRVGLGRLRVNLLGPGVVKMGLGLRKPRQCRHGKRPACGTSH